MEKSERAAIERARALLDKSHDPNSILTTITLMRGKDGLENHSDRAAILIAVALLEQALENAIWSHCVAGDDKIKTRLFRGDKDCPGPIGSFWAKVQMARALGVIGPKAFDGLEKLRHIRNLFAHTKEHIDFETPEVAGLCGFSTDDSTFWGGLAGEAPQNSKDKVFSFMQLLCLYLSVWDDPPKPKLFQNEALGKILG